MRTRQGLIRVTVLAALALVAACTSTDTGVQASGAASFAAPAPGTVQVIVNDLEGSNGGSLVGILYKGSAAPLPQKDERVVGGFVVRVDAESFSTVQTVAEPGVDYEGLFPYVSTTPVTLPRGEYMLALWAGSEVLGPYVRWVPADVKRACELAFKTGEDKGTTVTVTGLPELEPKELLDAGVRTCNTK
jgi:hypothetical protein